MLFKQPAEVLGVFETEFIGNFTYGFTGVEYFLLGYLDYLGLDMFMGTFSSLLFHQVPEIIG